MPTTLTIGFFVFGAVLVLIALLGGKFKIFIVVIASTTASVAVRFIAFVLGAVFLALAWYMDLTNVRAASAPVPPMVVAGTSLPSLEMASSTPQPAQTDPISIPSNTPVPSQPDPIDFILNYWQDVSNSNLERAWMQLSPHFRQAAHNNDYNDYVHGYQEMQLCQIVVNNTNLIQQDDSSAVITAHFFYYTGSQCNSSEYDFEMWLIYDNVSKTWLFDKNIIKS